MRISVPLTSFRPARHALWALMALTACDGGTHLRGRVQDSTGAAVPDATVVLAADYGSGATRQVDSVVTMTSSDGAYSVFLVHSPHADQPLTLRVSKSGFRPFEQHFLAGGLTSVDSVIRLDHNSAGN